jgi:aminoglycoside phosphotransferase (APT) family kinase protein
MTGRDVAGRCGVSLLVPHPERTAVMVADGPPLLGSQAQPTHARLPTVWLANPEPLVSEILAAVDVVSSEKTVVLRQVMTSSSSAGDSASSELDEVTLLVECDAGSVAAQPPSGWTWLDLDEQGSARLEPETSQAAVASWVRERAEGWSPLRPPWSRPGWFARASAWMVERMAAAGLTAVGAPRQHQLWGLSVLLRAPSAEGDVFLKCSADVLRREAAVTQALSRLMPGVTPEVIAIDERQGWMLMRDLGARELGEQAQSLWSQGVVAHAAIQQSMCSRTRELARLGLPVRSLADLAASVEEMRQDPELLERMPAELRKRWLATSPTLVKSCLRLDAIGPGPSLVHGDFHPWNVVHGPRTTRIFDWSDAAVSHPFLDLATYVFRTADISARHSLVDAYVAAWSTGEPKESLREAAALGLVVGALYQVQTYRALLPTLMANGADDDLADADLDWINRTLTRQEQGLHSPT